MYGYIRISLQDILAGYLCRTSLQDILAGYPCKDICFRYVLICLDICFRYVLICFEICLDLYEYLFGSIKISDLITFWVCSLALVGCQRCILEAGPACTHVVIIMCSYPSRQRRARQGPQHRARTGPAPGPHRASTGGAHAERLDVAGASPDKRDVVGRWEGGWVGR